MKKVMILLAVVLTANVLMAQKKDRTDAFMYNKNGQYEKAIASIEKCVNHEQFLGMKPNDQSQAWLYRASIYQNVLQSPDEAVRNLAPNAQEIIYESLMNCMQNENFVKDNKQEIITRVNAVMNSYYTVGADDYNNGKFIEAAPMFKKAYEIAKSLGNPDANEMLNLAATSYLRGQDYQSALDNFMLLKENGADGVDVYKHLAACYNGLGDSANAMAMINAGLEKDPSDASLIVEKVNSYMKEGKNVEAIEDINRLRELDPENAQLLFVLGTIYGEENNKDIYDSDKAIQYYEQAIAINPDYYDAIYNLGAMYISLSNKLKTQANELPLDKVKEYNALVEQAEDLVRTGLPYVKKAYEAQPTPEVKQVLKTMYVQLKMNDEAKALDAE
ncbi:MAG: tetratricopeptide repeat protein [Bacteroidales bacterium]|nr:tetratricopeptide repeat protein [Bacteroidales bacterium]